MKRHAAGFSLIEVMVGMVIIAFIWVGVAMLFKTQVGASVGNQDETELQASVQAVGNMISNSIIMAGFGKIQVQPIVHTNVTGSAVGGDTIQMFTAGQNGNSIATFVYGGAAGVSGTNITVRCYGPYGSGGRVDITRDAVYISAATPTKLYFVDVFKGTLLTTVTQPQIVSASVPSATGDCQVGAWDFDRTGTNDPVINLTISPGLGTAIPTGTTVYALRGANDSVTYALSTTNSTLTQNGAVLLQGVEDFQVRYRVKENPAWLDSLAGVDTSKLDGIRFALVVRSQRSQPQNIKDPRTTITTFDHSYSVTMPYYSRKQYEFIVRPKNNAL